MVKRCLIAALWEKLRQQSGTSMQLKGTRCIR